MPSRNPGDILQNNPYATPTLQYPSNLGDHGEEPYIIFDIISSIVNDNRSFGVIALNFPSELRVSYSANYKELNMGLDMAKAFGFSSLGDFTNDLKSGNFSNMYAGGAGRYLNKMIESIGSGITANAVADWERAHGKVLNPHMAALFEGIGFRTFSFNFDFMAKNEQESKDVRDIIKKFKYHMHPGVDDGALSKWLYYPENFKIALRSPTSGYLFEISKCALTDLTVDYGAMQNPVFFKKTGAPVNVKLAMQFKELEIMTKRRINEGTDYQDDRNVNSPGA